MKLIPLTQGLFAQVDDADFDYLNQWKWCIKKAHNKTYAMRALPRVYVNGKPTRKYVQMHSEVIGDIAGICDHKDGNGLNNQRGNLREATYSQNGANRISKNKYMGIRQEKRSGKFYAEITKNGKATFLGSFKNENDAADAYNKAAIKIHKEFANLNIIPNE